MGSNFIDYLTTVVKWRKLIITNFSIICLLTAIFTLIMPKTFTAKTTIFGPQQEGDSFGLSSIVSSLPIGKLGLGGISEETYTFIAIINSRTVLESISQKFHLMELYGLKNMEQ